jgi:hypothetical protein
MTLRGLDGAMASTEAAWAGGEALILIGHRNCKTTRQTIPYVDRIHRRRGKGAVRVILQDDAETARALKADQKLDVPILLEADPYPLAEAVDLVAVPTLFFVGEDGTIQKTTEAFHRADLEDYARRLGVEGPLFTPEDRAPAQKPG